MFIFVCVCDLDRDKISIRYFRFLPGFRKYCVFVMVARQKMSPKSSFWKTHPPLPEDFLGRWGVWCYEGSGMSPSREDIGSLSGFPSFRDEAQLDRCSQKWSKFEKIFWWRKFSWPREMKTLDFLRFTIFENIEKWSYSFLFARGERSELESAELFPGRCFRARLGSKGTKRAIDSKSRMGKWWNIYTNIYIFCVRKMILERNFDQKSDFRDERKRLLSSSIESKPRSNTHTHTTHMS